MYLSMARSKSLQLVQLITLALLYPNARSFFPGLFCILNGKSEIHYTIAFEHIKLIITDNGHLANNLKFATLGFEYAQRNALLKDFPGIRCIDCLFHLKQAWYRWGRSHKLCGTKEDREATTTIMEN